MGNAYRSVLAGGGAGTPITPSNSSPVSMTGGETYTPTTNGVAVESVTNLTPANSSPPSISTGNIYKPTTSGKAIASIATSGSSVTPSSSGKYFYAGWNKMEASGYAYSSKPTIESMNIVHKTTNFKVTSSYTYVGSGVFISFYCKRGSVSTAPYSAIYIKEGSTYRQISTNLLMSTSGTRLDATDLVYGDFYIKNTQGSDFTTTNLDVMYLTN